VILKNTIPAASLCALNGVSSALVVTDLVLPHVVQGTVGSVSYTTTVEALNLSAFSQTVTVTFTPEDGGPPRSIQRTLAGNAGFRVGVETLFGFTEPFQSGWIRLSGTRSLAGFIVIADTRHGGETAIAGMAHPESRLIFGHIADLPPWSTGVAIVNAGASPAAVEIYAINSDGATIGKATISIAAGGKTSRLLRDWIPATQTRSSDGGSIFVRSTVPVYGLSVFLTRDAATLSNVPALSLPPDFAFSPR
jgi:hypothetical protein